MSDGNYYQRDPRFTFSSALLLIIFVGAVAFVMIVAYVMAPWDGDDDPTTEATVAETQTPPPEEGGEGEEVAGIPGEEAETPEVTEAAEAAQ